MEIEKVFHPTFPPKSCSCLCKILEVFASIKIPIIKDNYTCKETFSLVSWVSRHLLALTCVTDLDHSKGATEFRLSIPALMRIPCSWARDGMERRSSSGSASLPLTNATLGRTLYCSRSCSVPLIPECLWATRVSCHHYYLHGSADRH